MFLLNSRHPLVTATPFDSGSKSLHLMEVHLLPKLRCQFAEFLNHGSLKRLGILYPSTCVGLRYGHLNSSPRGFSWKHGINHFARPEGIARHNLSTLMEERIFLLLPPTGLNRDIQHPDDLPFSVPPWGLCRCRGGTGILTCSPSPTPFGLGLGTD